jgi:rhodanese-related sulfurtransferase
MAIRNIDAREADLLVKSSKAVLVDVREPAEHAREHIAGAALAPLSCFEEGCFASSAAPVIFHCQSGNRTRTHESKLAGSGAKDVFVLTDGLNGWKAAKLPTVLDRAKPIELQRQVQIAAGALVLTGLVLAVSVSPWFAGLSAFVGAGLIITGTTGWCGMAKLLAAMPWNRVAA